MKSYTSPVGTNDGGYLMLSRPHPPALFFHSTELARRSICRGFLPPTICSRGSFNMTNAAVKTEIAFVLYRKFCLLWMLGLLYYHIYGSYVVVLVVQDSHLQTLRVDACLVLFPEWPHCSAQAYVALSMCPSDMPQVFFHCRNRRQKWGSALMMIAGSNQLLILSVANHRRTAGSMRRTAW